MVPKQTMMIIDKTREQLEEELQFCRSQATLALSRYEFLYVEELNERIDKINQQLSAL